MRKDLNLRMKVLLGIDTRTNGSGNVELRDLQVVKTLIVPCKLTKSGSVITEKEQWRKPAGQHGVKDHVRRWGSQTWDHYHSSEWWAPSNLCVRKKDVSHPVQWGSNLDFLVREGLIPASNSYPEETAWRIVLVLPDEIRAFLLKMHQEVKVTDGAKRERGRRSDKRSNYAYRAKGNWQTANSAFRAAKTEEEATTLGVAVFRARMAVVKAEGEAERRWPTDLDLKAPGDAGVLGELALALSEDDEDLANVSQAAINSLVVTTGVQL